MFLYNPKRHTLHIKGLCPHSKGSCPDYIAFDSEDDALAYDGHSVGMCKLCQKKREAKTKAAKKEQV